MANVTDPLARAIHSTDPQNLIEYITRQKIYDSLYWKEECFGLSAKDVAAKAAELKALGSSYGGNNKPTRFLCLVLKLLQIQPEEGIVEELVTNEDFKYVRTLGAFYLRLTGRPAEIYEMVEPLFNDFRKLRFREPTGWTIVHVDEFADALLTADRYCGIALPHLPKRDVLVSAGYLDGPRRSALAPLIEEQAEGDAERFLQKLANEGNAAAVVALEDRKWRKAEEEKRERHILKERSDSPGASAYDGRESRRSTNSERYGDDSGRDHSERCGESRGSPVDGHYGRSRASQRDGQVEDDGEEKDCSKYHKKKKSSKDDKKYGSLFKKSSKSKAKSGSSKTEEKDPATMGTDTTVLEGSEEYWNEQRAKLGLKPLKG